MKKRIYFILLMAGFVLLSTACSKAEKSDSKDGLTVVTTFYPMYDFTKEIVGDAGEVKLLIPSGVEPHEFEPSAKNIVSIQEATVFVYNSQYLETWVPSVEKTLDTKHLTVIEASKGIKLEVGGEDEEEDEEADNGHEHYDPHVWLSPNLAKKEVETIRDALIKAYPKGKETFEKNAASYLEKLSALDEAYQNALIVAKQKNFVTQHAAFGYLAKAYGLTQIAIAGLSPDEEPSVAKLAELKKFVTENKLSIIYFEETANDKIARTLADECGVSLAVLNPLEGLTKEEQKAGENYVSVMYKNLEELQKTVK